jgi:hypothetical protein
VAFANIVRVNNWFQSEIPKILGVDKSVVYKDVAILREQSRETLKNILGKIVVGIKTTCFWMMITISAHYTKYEIEK